MLPKSSPFSLIQSSEKNKSKLLVFRKFPIATKFKMAATCDHTYYKNGDSSTNFLSQFQAVPKQESFEASQKSLRSPIDTSLTGLLSTGGAFTSRRSPSPSSALSSSSKAFSAFKIQPKVTV